MISRFITIPFSKKYFIIYANIMHKNTYVISTHVNNLANPYIFSCFLPTTPYSLQQSSSFFDYSDI